MTRTSHEREEQQKKVQAEVIWRTWTNGTKPKETGNQEEKFNCEESGRDVEKEGKGGEWANKNGPFSLFHNILQNLKDRVLTKAKYKTT